LTGIIFSLLGNLVRRVPEKSLIAEGVNMKVFCEICGNRALMIRRITKGGKWHGRLKISSDRHYPLCRRHYLSQRESFRQTQSVAVWFPPRLTVGQKTRLAQIYADF